MGTVIRLNHFFSIALSLVLFLLLLVVLKSISIGQWYHDETYINPMGLSAADCRSITNECFWLDLIRDVLGFNYSRIFPEETSAATLIRFLWHSLPVFLLSAGLWIILSILIFMALYKSSLWGRVFWPAIRAFALLPVFIIAPLLLYFFFPSISHSSFFLRVLLLSLLLSLRIIALTVDTVWDHLKDLLVTAHSRTMFSLGFSRNQVVFFWLRPLYLYPIAHKLPGLFIQWLAGSLLGEMFFNVQGVSWLLVQALQGRDWSLVSHIVFCMLMTLASLRAFVTAWPVPGSLTQASPKGE